MSELRDRIARVLFDLNAGDDWNGEPLVWDDGEIAESFRDCFRRQADAVLAAINERYIIVDPLITAENGSLTWAPPGHIDAQLRPGQEWGCGQPGCKACY